MDVKKKLLQYLRQNKIPASQVSEATGVNLSKLTDDLLELNATEFCEICYYLELDPKKLYDMKGE